MNKKRREQLMSAKAMLSQAEQIVESARDDEQDCFDNMPENLQYSERAEAMDRAIDAMSDAISDIESAMTNIDSACNGDN